MVALAPLSSGRRASDRPRGIGSSLRRRLIYGGVASSTTQGVIRVRCSRRCLPFPLWLSWRGNSPRTTTAKRRTPRWTYSPLPALCSSSSAAAFTAGVVSVQTGALAARRNPSVAWPPMRTASGATRVAQSYSERLKPPKMRSPPRCVCECQTPVFCSSSLTASCTVVIRCHRRGEFGDDARRTRNSDEPRTVSTLWHSIARVGEFPVGALDTGELSQSSSSVGSAHALEEGVCRAHQQSRIARNERERTSSRESALSSCCLVAHGAGALAQRARAPVSWIVAEQALREASMIELQLFCTKHNDRTRGGGGGQTIALPQARPQTFPHGAANALLPVGACTKAKQKKRVWSGCGRRA